MHDQDPNKLLEKCFNRIRRKNLYNEIIMSKMNNSFYIYSSK